MSSEEDFLEEKLGNINKHIDILYKSFEKGIPKESIFTIRQYIDVYTECYNICIKKTPNDVFSDKLYENYYEQLKLYLNNINDRVNISDNNDLIKTMNYEFEKFKLVNKWLYMFFRYLDRYYLKAKDYPCLQDTGNQEYYNIVFKSTFNSQVQNNALKSLLNKINKYRNNRNEDIASDVRQYINIIWELLYKFFILYSCKV